MVPVIVHNIVHDFLKRLQSWEYYYTIKALNNGYFDIINILYSSKISSFSRFIS